QYLSFEYCTEANDLADFSSLMGAVFAGGLLSFPMDRNGTLGHWQEAVINKADPGDANDLTAVVNTEAPVGMSQAQIQAFLDLLSSGFKLGGGKGLAARVGTVEIPFCL